MPNYITFGVKNGFGLFFMLTKMVSESIISFNALWPTYWLLWQQIGYKITLWFFVSMVTEKNVFSFSM